MITDRRELAGLGTYLRDLNQPNITNLATLPAGAVATTEPVVRNRQQNIHLVGAYITGHNLAPLLERQSEPLIRIDLVKEIFPGLYANPYASRITSAVGRMDLAEGRFDNSRAMQVDDVWTIVALGTGVCSWTSRRYELPSPVRLDAAAWELAASRHTPSGSFTYDLVLTTTHADGSTQTRWLAAGLEPAAARLAEGLDLVDVVALEYAFTANVTTDAYLRASYSGWNDPSLGRALLQSVSVLEAVESSLHFHSLAELLDAGYTDQIIDWQGGRLTRLKAALDIDAVLTASDTQDVTSGRYERIQAEIANGVFDSVEIRVLGAELTLPPD